MTTFALAMILIAIQQLSLQNTIVPKTEADELLVGIYIISLACFGVVHEMSRYSHQLQSMSHWVHDLQSQQQAFYVWADLETKMAKQLGLVARDTALSIDTMTNIYGDAVKEGVLSWSLITVNLGRLEEEIDDVWSLELKTDDFALHLNNLRETFAAILSKTLACELATFSAALEAALYGNTLHKTAESLDVTMKRIQMIMEDERGKPQSRIPWIWALLVGERQEPWEREAAHLTYIRTLTDDRHRLRELPVPSISLQKDVSRLRTMTTHALAWTEQLKAQLESLLSSQSRGHPDFIPSPPKNISHIAGKTADISSDVLKAWRLNIRGLHKVSIGSSVFESNERAATASWEFLQRWSDIAEDLASSNDSELEGQKPSFNIPRIALHK